MSVDSHADRREREGEDAINSSTVDFADGRVTLDYIPGDGMKLVLKAYYEGDEGDTRLHHDELSPSELTSATYSGKFLNRVRDAAKEYKHIDGEQLKQEMREWFDAFAERVEEEKEEFLGDDVKTLLDGVRYPVEVYKGETSTEWHITVSFEGYNETLKFDTDAMLNDDATGSINTQIGRKFLRNDIEVTADEWGVLREKWNAKENRTVAGVESKTDDEIIADVVLDELAAEIRVTTEREAMANDRHVAWFDDCNTAGVEWIDEFDGEQPVVWVQSAAVQRALDARGESVTYTQTLARTLKETGELLGPTESRKWATGNGRAGSYWPFTPDALGVSKDDLSTPGEEIEAAESEEVDV